MKKVPKLPTGQFHFPNLIAQGYTYVDKTHLLYRLIQEEPGCFLARPRRFGKSLLVSTLEALFQGKKELFKGLWIETSDYEWKEHPIIHLDMSGGSSGSPEKLEKSLKDTLIAIAKQYDIESIERELLSSTLEALVIEMFRRYGPIVVLVDEYDYPLVHNTDDLKLVEENRKFLQEFFANIKSQQRYLRFIFVTGVSQFTKVSLFSGLNNLEMVSFQEEYATLLGLTEEEITKYFAPNIQAVATSRNTSETEILLLLKKWYNGYSYTQNSNVPRVYNPVSVFKFLKTGILDNYWFSTGTPTMVITLAKQRDFSLVDLENDIPAGSELEETHDIGTISIPVLLYQTGYLTIRKFDPQSSTYFLNFPNEEVRQSFLEYLVRAFSSNPSEIQGLYYRLAQHLQQHDFQKFFEVFNLFLASIPYFIHEDAESYYHSLLYLFLKTLGFKVNAEVPTSRGRMDMLLKTPDCIYVFEFKINKTAAEALNQIKARDYHAQFKLDKRLIMLVGASFSTQSKKLTDWVSEKV
ncbi:MAG TPA: AAA family ATPase [Chlamydiales bacterium]|nr:AAA family ATPase [Chlamydiales bacterium]